MKTATNGSSAPAVEPRAVERKRFRGVVRAVGKMAKTVRVSVAREVWHPRVRKRVRRVRTFLVHDDRGDARKGDAVVIEETRPISKRKHFRIRQILSRAAVSTAEPAPDGQAEESGAIASRAP